MTDTAVPFVDFMSGLAKVAANLWQKIQTTGGGKGDGDGPMTAEKQNARLAAEKQASQRGSDPSAGGGQTAQASGGGGDSSPASPAEGQQARSPALMRLEERLQRAILEKQLAEAEIEAAQARRQKYPKALAQDRFRELLNQGYDRAAAEKIVRQEFGKYLTPPKQGKSAAEPKIDWSKATSDVSDMMAPTGGGQAAVSEGPLTEAVARLFPASPAGPGAVESQLGAVGGTLGPSGRQPLSASGDPYSTNLIPFSQPTPTEGLWLDRDRIGGPTLDQMPRAVATRGHGYMSRARW